MYLLDTLLVVVKYACYFLALWVLCILTYRIGLHPLRNYPGPFLAKVTYGYSCLYALRGRHHINTYKNFQKYGTSIPECNFNTVSNRQIGRVYREAPNRLLFNSLTSIQDIYYNPHTTKGSAYRHPGALEQPNIFNVKDNAEHRRKRKVIGQVVSDRSLRPFSPMMSEQIDIFLRQLLHSSRQGEIVNMTVACNRLGIDVVGHPAFGCALNTQTETTNRFIPETMFSGIYMNNLYYTWPLLGHISPVLRWLGSKKVDLFSQAVEKMISARTSQPTNAKPDFYAAVTGEGGLHQDELWGEALFFVLAGGSTVATATCGSLFHLSRHPVVYARLSAEIRGTFSSGHDIQPGPKLASCSYLRAVIDESLRMTPPAPSPLWRELETDDSSREGPFVVDGHAIPPGTEVGVHLWAIMYDPTYFEDPFAFRPERWLLPQDGTASLSPREREARATMRRAHVSFGLGDRSCAGKSMAYMEASLTIARVLWYFDFEQAPGEAGKFGIGQGGRNDPWDGPDQFQIYDVLGADHDGPNLVFQPRGEYWMKLM
ncbi:cytochrome P450 [Xylariaceae sp. FL0662B]|nr:cytochrome P450 [Xylariaceae sp. FL0662B]